MIDLQKTQELIRALLSVVVTSVQDPQKTAITAIMQSNLLEIEISDLEKTLSNVKMSSVDEEDNPISFLNASILSLTKGIQSVQESHSKGLIEKIQFLFTRLNALFKTPQTKKCSFWGPDLELPIDVLGLTIQPPITPIVSSTESLNPLGQSLIKALHTHCAINFCDKRGQFHFNPELIAATFSLRTNALAPSTSTTSNSSTFSLIGTPPQSPMSSPEPLALKKTNSSTPKEITTLESKTSPIPSHMDALFAQGLFVPFTGQNLLDETSTPISIVNKDGKLSPAI